MEELSDIECEDCGDPVPLKRIKLVNTKVCVGCMEIREKSGQSKRHRMGYHIQTRGEELESIDTFIVRSTED